MALDTWLQDAPGRAMNPDNAFGLQCKDVIDDLCNALWPDIGWARAVGAENAKDAYAAANPIYFDKLPSDAPMQRGDCPVWGAAWGGGAGHIAVVESVSGNQFTVVQQDGYVNTQPARLVPYSSRSGMIGILRPKITQEEAMATITEQAEMALSLAIVGKYPTRSELRYSNRPATQENLDGMITYWAQQSRIPALEEAARQRLLTREEVIVIGELMFGGQDNFPDDLITKWTNKPLDEFLQTMISDPSWQKYIKEHLK